MLCRVVICEVARICTASLYRERGRLGEVVVNEQDAVFGGRESVHEYMNECMNE